MSNVEELEILLAWEAVELSEGQAARALGVDRLTARGMRKMAIERGVGLAEAGRTPAGSGSAE